MTEAEELLAVRRRIAERMSGGPLGDGIGPGNTAKRILEEFDAPYTPEEIHEIWRQGKEHDGIL